MTDMDDEAMKAMARRICADHYRARARNPKNSYGHEMAHAERLINGDSDDWDCMQTALAAIIETQERDAALAYRVCAETRHVTLGDKVSAAIRSGQQFRKDV